MVVRCQQQAAQNYGFQEKGSESDELKACRQLSGCGAGTGNPRRAQWSEFKCQWSEFWEVKAARTSRAEYRKGERHGDQVAEVYKGMPLAKQSPACV